MLERLFRLRENKTTVRTEVVAGLTTFMTMAYILADLARGGRRARRAAERLPAARDALTHSAD